MTNKSLFKMAFKLNLLIRIALYLLVLIALLSDMTISGPIVTSDSTASLASQTTSLSLEATKSLETRVKHNWAFVCYDKNGLPDKDIYHQCADSLTGYYCDANGMVSWRVRSSFVCWDACECTEVGISNLENCVWGLVILSCYTSQQLAQMPPAELLEGVRNGTMLLPNGTTIEDFIPGNSPVATSFVLGPISATRHIPSKVPTSLSAIASSKATLVQHFTLDRRSVNVNDYAYVCYKAGGGFIPDRWLTDFCSKHGWYCDSSGKFVHGQFIDACNDVCDCINMNPKPKFGVMCWSSINGQVCAKVINETTNIETTSSAISCTSGYSCLGPEATFDIYTLPQTWATTLPRSTISALSAPSATLSAVESSPSITLDDRAVLEPRQHNFAFVCYETGGEVADRLLTRLCQRNWGWGCNFLGQMFYTMYDDVCKDNCKCVSLTGGAPKYGKMCWGSINGQVCAKIVNGTTSLETSSASPRLGPLATFNIYTVSQTWATTLTRSTDPATQVTATNLLDSPIVVPSPTQTNAAEKLQVTSFTDCFEKPSEVMCLKTVGNGEIVTTTFHDITSGTLRPSAI